MKLNMEHHFNGQHLALAVVLYIFAGVASVTSIPNHDTLEVISKLCLILVALKTLLNIKSLNDIKKIWSKIVLLVHKVW